MQASIQPNLTFKLFAVLAEFGTEDMDTGAEADSSMAKVAKPIIASRVSI